MDKQEFIDNICRQAGISKRELARLVGTHHTMLGKYQAGTRNLPAATMQQLVALHTLLNSAQPAAVTAMVPSQAFMEQAKDRAANCREKLQKLQEKYKAMQFMWQTAATALQLAGMVASHNISACAAPSKKQSWIEEQQYRATKQLQRTGPEAQRELFIQIALLEKEATLWEETVGYFK